MSAASPPWSKSPSYEDLLAVECWTRSHLEALVRYQVVEDLHVEYKSGGWLTRESMADRAQDMRWYIVGFANADGGVLVIGMDENVRASDGRRVPSALSVIGHIPPDGLGAWITRAISPGAVFPALQFAPRIHEVCGADGRVDQIVVVVPPSHNTISTVRYGGKNLFPARMGESTEALDEWTVRAILHGTRQTPRVSLAIDTALGSSSVQRGLRLPSTPDRQQDLIVTLRLFLHNDALVAARGVHVGLVSPLGNTSSNAAVEAFPLSPALRRETGVRDGRDHEIQHLQVRLGSGGPTNLLPPFGVIPFDISFGGRLPSEVSEVDLQIPFYVTGENFSPSWYQLRIATWHSSQALLLRATEASPVAVSWTALTQSPFPIRW